MINEYTPTKDNMFFMCYLVEILCRATRNDKPTVTGKMSRDYILHICKAEEAYHCLSEEQLVDEQKEVLGLTRGMFNNIRKSRYIVPSEISMARLYSDIIFLIDGNPVDNFFKVMSSPITLIIDDYNGSLYWENIHYIRDCILAGEIILLGPTDDDM